MTVTELGLLKGTSATFTPEFRSALETALAAQTRWLKLDAATIAAAGPSGPITGGRAWLLQQIEDPGSVMMASTWTDLAQHNAWIATDPDIEAIMGPIGQHLYKPKTSGAKPDPAQAVVLVHAEGDVFTGTTETGDAVALLDCPIISISRMAVKAGQREAFAAAFAANKDCMENHCGGPTKVRGHWRADPETDTATDVVKDEFLSVCGWSSLEVHAAFSKHPDAARTAAFMDFVDGVETKQYRRVL